MTSELERLRERAEGCGLFFSLHDDGDCFLIADKPIADLTEWRRGNADEVCLICKVSDVAIQAAHWLLDGYERRDWVECPDCTRGIRPKLIEVNITPGKPFKRTPKAILEGCVTCNPHGGLGQVPPTEEK